jgi:hypothetical protein
MKKKCRDSPQQQQQQQQQQQLQRRLDNSRNCQKISLGYNLVKFPLLKNKLNLTHRLHIIIIFQDITVSSNLIY